jgi:hypothetical protein
MGVPPAAITSLLSVIQSMEFFLHMAHGDSMLSYSVTMDSTTRAAQEDGTACACARSLESRVTIVCQII